MKILYAICTWGLGHASRSLPVIRAMLSEGHEIGVISSGRALNFLRNELGGMVRYHDVPDYPAPYAENRSGFYLKFTWHLPSIIRGIRNEHVETERLVNKYRYHRIVSDNRYGVYRRGVKSYLITHQLRFIAPRRMKTIEKIAEKFVMRHGRGFERYIVPDDEEGTLSGDLSHNLRYIQKHRILYAGALSDFRKLDIDEDIDLLISITGPEPQRSILEKKVMEKVEEFPKKTVITLGKSEKYGKIYSGNAIIYPYLPRDKREEIMNSSKIILSRSGYSTIMDLAVLGKKAIFVPTPAQTEQEYLSEYHMRKGTYYSMKQEEFSIENAMNEVKKYTGIIMDGRKSVETIIQEVLS